ncbi:hypothetical protein GCM10009560_43360 [Nonomuraea longicatena]|uniref:Integral membrane protein n=1 Tax=Nonomuraea longicatena TaxID=83682 RepID=A0ABP4ADX5_9ACTN
MKDGRAFGYDRNSATTMWMWVFAIVVEGVVLDLFFGSLVLMALHAYFVLSMLGMIAAARVRPHVVTDGELRLRSGGAFDLRVPRRLLVGARAVARTHDGGFLEADGERLALVVDARTNVVVELAEPVAYTRPLGRTGSARELRLFVDDPREFLAALSISTPPARHGGDRRENP